MTIAFVNSVGMGYGISGGTSSAIDTTGADFLVAAVALYGAFNPTLSDSKGNTWTGLTQRVNGSFRFRMFYCFPTMVGTGHTFTLIQANSYPSLAVQAFSGVGSYEAENGNTGAGSGATPGVLTPAADGSLLLAGASHTGTGTVTFSDGYTNAGSVTYQVGNHLACTLGYLIQTSKSTKNPSMTGTAGSWSAGHAVFAPPAATGKVWPYRRLRRVA